jgi:hypothetical protein
MSALGITRREFARLDGCDEKQVRRGIEAGRLSVLSDGTIDPTLAGTGWRRRNRNGAKERKPSPETVDKIVRAKVIPVADSSRDDLNAAIRRREEANALLKELEYDTKSGAVVEVAKVAKLFGEACSKVRTKLLAIPAEQAPAIHRCATVAEVQALLIEIITEALEELSRDPGGDDDEV